MAICENIRITWKDQPLKHYDGRIENRCLIVQELEVEPGQYKPWKLGPEIPLSAKEAELLFDLWFNHQIIDPEFITFQ